MTLLTAPELASALASDRPVRVLDVRWSLPEPDGSAAYGAGHIPGAVYVDLESELSDHSVPGRGRHPLPSGADLQKALRRWGINDGDTVVVYDDWNRAGSSRAWWVLSAAGLADVAILDGGWAAWVEAALPVSTESPVPSPGNVAVAHLDLDHGALDVLDEDKVREIAARGGLLDARAPERYRGDVEPIDPVAGHIPGARNLPFSSLLDESGRFRPTADIAAALATGATPLTGAYCGSGVTAAVVVAAAAHAGTSLALYPGSWSQWVSRPENEVTTGG